MPRRSRLLWLSFVWVFVVWVFVVWTAAAAHAVDAVPEARGLAVAAAEALRAELERGPLGVVLAPELELDWLDAALARDEPEPAELAWLEGVLRRVLPGRVQTPLDTLRQRVGRLARLARGAAEGPEAAAAARAVLERHLAGPHDVSPEADAAVRQAFATLAGVAATATDEQAVRRLRTRLSAPNLSVLLRREFVQEISRQTLTQPVEFRERREGATITGCGEVVVGLSLGVPESRGESHLVVHASGMGHIDARADRRRVHLAAAAVPHVTGRADIRLTPRTVVTAPPEIAARFTTRLAGLHIDGLLGRSRLVQRVAGRAARQTLSANDPAVARQIEQALTPRIEEEAATLAYRINGLLQWGVWERLAALDFLPEVWLANDALGLRSDTWYARDDQLGGIAPRPEIPADRLARLDIVTWAHESALNNTLATVGGLRLDEATVRGLWEVQCKLWTAEWDGLAAARIPAVITLAAERPLAVRLAGDGIEAVLRATSCERAGRVVDDQPREIRLRYRLVRDAEGWAFTRGDAAFVGEVPADVEAVWQETLGLFFGRAIRPLPRYRPSGLSEYLAVAHVDVRDGWLVVGAERVRGTARGGPPEAAGGDGDDARPAGRPGPPREVAVTSTRPVAPASPAAISPAPISPAAVAPAADAVAARFARTELLFCFQGKGSCLPYDAGVLREAWARLPALREGRVIVAGNSSGSIPAGYFACHGWSDATVRHCEERLIHGNRDAVRTMEDVGTKFAKLSRGQGTEIEHADLIEFIAFALGVSRWQDTRDIGEIVRRSRARPVHPCLIVACNKEVLEDRHPEDRFAPGRLKEIDLATMQVSWKPEVHAWYRRHPDRFRRDHPDLVLRDDRVVGRAVTFFVDRSMHELLSRIPAAERIADLRLMTDAADVALAILASASEPTYFPVVVDPDRGRIRAADGVLESLVGRRTYYGGYIISLPGQDVRRMLPGIRVLGTGWRHNPLVARRLLADWLLADCEEVAQRAEWWADMEINPDREFESHIEVRSLSGAEEARFGARRAREFFAAAAAGAGGAPAGGVGLPVFVQPPRFREAAAAAILPAAGVRGASDVEMFTDEIGPDGGRVLRTLRGLGPLLDSPH